MAAIAGHSVGVQTDDIPEFASQSDKDSETSDSSAVTCDIKFLFKDDEDSSSCETDVESNVPESLYSSCVSTRRNSLLSDTDLEAPFRILFGGTSSSSVSSRSNVGSPSLTPPPSSQQQNNVLLVEGLDVLLRRLTCERFLELRRIQLGERPVTGSNARQNLDSFFHRAIHGPTEEERQQQEQANRPVHVANDVNTLQESALVQSALQNDFRQQLETTLMTRLPAISTRQTAVQEQIATPNPNQPMLQSTTLTRPSVGDSGFRARLEQLFSNRIPTIRQSSARRQVSQLRSHPSVSNGYTPAPRSAPPVDSSSQVQAAQTSNLQISIETGLQLLTESITEDLNRLQSLQVVSNMLRTDFREELEHMVQARVENVGNGVAVQNFIQALPHSPRPSQQRQQTQATSFQTATDSATRSDIQALRQQIDEMKRMTAMSMEIQMDTQRAIRQEVAAIFTTFMQEYLVPRASGQAATPRQPQTIFHPPRSHPVSSGQCVICIDRSVDTVLYQCGHMCVCHQCGLQLKMDGHNCPMCRAPIRDVIRAYQTQ